MFVKQFHKTRKMENSKATSATSKIESMNLKIAIKQSEIINSFTKIKNGSLDATIVTASTGSGKSLSLAHYAFKAGFKKVVLTVPRVFIANSLFSIMKTLYPSVGVS